MAKFIHIKDWNPFLKKYEPVLLNIEQITEISPAGKAQSMIFVKHRNKAFLVAGDFKKVSDKIISEAKNDN